MSGSSKALARALLRGEAPARVPFIPWVCRFAARLEQLPAAAMLADAGLLSRALLNAQRLFGYDAICNVFDPSLEAEACGCTLRWPEGDGAAEVVSHPLAGAAEQRLDVEGIEARGRLPAVLEATRRLVAVAGGEVAVIGVLTGPVALARRLAGEALSAALDGASPQAVGAVALAGRVGQKLCRAYGELGVDAVVIADDTLGRLRPEGVAAAAPALRSIANVARFYDAATLLLAPRCGAGEAASLLDLPVDGLVLAAPVTEEQLLQSAPAGRRRLRGLALQTAALLGTPEQAGEAAGRLLAAAGPGSFLATEWEVPPDIGVEVFHALMAAVRGQSGS